MTQRLLTALLMLATAASAQHRVDPRNIYHRLIVVVPLVGQGTQADPKRPQYAPAPPAAAVSQTPAAPTAPKATTSAPGAVASASAPTILAYMHTLSDDGKYAITEFVAQDMAAFQSILNDKSLTVFVKGTCPLSHRQQ